MANTATYTEEHRAAGRRAAPGAYSGIVRTASTASGAANEESRVQSKTIARRKNIFALPETLFHRISIH